jgi:TonB family protein
MQKSFLIPLTILLIPLFQALGIAQTDTTFYSERNGQLSKDFKATAYYYELNNGLNRNGLVIQYYMDHTEYGRSTYHNNYFDGPFKRYYKNRQSKVEGNYQEGIEVGMIKRFYQNGQLHSEINQQIILGGEKVTRNTRTAPQIVSRTINTWDSLGNQQVLDGNGFYNAPEFDTNLFLNGEYSEGVKVGEWNGTIANVLTFKETYDQGGELISGESYNEDGSIDKYTLLEEAIAYPGGPKEWDKFLRKTLKYPKKARKEGIEGAIYLSFLVDKEGDVRNVEVISGIGGDCDEEAVRVLSLSEKWIPAKQRGKIIESIAAIRLIFKIR